MDKAQFNDLLNQITGEKLDIQLLTKDGKWYEKEYSKTDTISENSTYGIIIDHVIWFDLKLGKSESFIKTFITQYVNKYLSKRYDNEGGELGKDKAYQLLEQRIGTLRLGFKTLYSTNYGIGQWVLMNSKKNIDETKSELSTFLKSKGIKFENEYSDAHWVYRYKFLGSFLDHNELIKEISKL